MSKSKSKVRARATKARRCQSVQESLGSRQTAKMGARMIGRALVRGVMRWALVRLSGMQCVYSANAVGRATESCRIDRDAMGSVSLLTRLEYWVK